MIQITVTAEVKHYTLFFVILIFLWTIQGGFSDPYPRHVDEWYNGIQANQLSQGNNLDVSSFFHSAPFLLVTPFTFFFDIFSSYRSISFVFYGIFIVCYYLLAKSVFPKGAVYVGILSFFLLTRIDTLGPAYFVASSLALLILLYFLYALKSYIYDKKEIHIILGFLLGLWYPPVFLFMCVIYFCILLYYKKIPSKKVLFGVLAFGILGISAASYVFKESIVTLFLTRFIFDVGWFQSYASINPFPNISILLVLVALFALIFTKDMGIYRVWIGVTTVWMVFAYILDIAFIIPYERLALFNSLLIPLVATIGFYELHKKITSVFHFKLLMAIIFTIILLTSQLFVVDNPFGEESVQAVLSLEDEPSGVVFTENLEGVVVKGITHHEPFFSAFFNVEHAGLSNGFFTPLPCRIKEGIIKDISTPKYIITKKPFECLNKTILYNETRQVYRVN